MKAKEKKVSLPTWKKILLPILLTLGGITLFLAQSVMWVNHIIFDRQTFTHITTTVLTTQESRDAIASTIVDRALENRPVANRLLGDKAVTFVSGMLASDISEKVLEKTSDKAYGYITSPNRQDIALDLSAIQGPLSAIISFAETRGKEVKFDPNVIPQNIVLVESDELPDIASYIQKMLIAGGLLWFSTILFFAVYIFIDKQGRIRRYYFVTLTVGLVAAIAILSGPFIPPAVSSLISQIQLRGIVEDLSQAFISPFTNQMYLTLGLAALAAAVMRFRWIFGSIWKSLKNAATSKTKGSSKK